MCVCVFVHACVKGGVQNVCVFFRSLTEYLTS
jgi:hypothetical protein